MNDGIISAIYSAPIADRPWVSLLPTLRTLSSASGVMLKFAVPGQRVGARLMPDADWDHEPASSLYEQFYQFKDPVSHEGLEVGALYNYPALIGEDSFSRSEFNRCLLRRFGIDHTFVMYLGRHANLDAWLFGSRRNPLGPFLPQNTKPLSDVTEHLIRATEIYARMATLRRDRLTYAGALDTAGMGVILIDETGRILDKSDRAHRLLSAPSSPVRQVGERLSFGEAGRKAFTSVLRTLEDDSRTAATMLARDDGGGRVGLLVRKAANSVADQFANSPTYIVYLSDQANPSQPALAPLLPSLLEITHVEARLVAALCEGLSLDEAATRLGVTLTTARTYCKRVLAKTGVSRQTDLVRLALNSVARYGV